MERGLLTAEGKTIKSKQEGASSSAQHVQGGLLSFPFRRKEAIAAMASFGAVAPLLLSGLSCCSETVFIVEISLTCKNRVQNMALYADVSGKQFPVTRGQDVGQYQVSWSLEHKSARASTYEVRFFNEESYSLLRKAQRSNEDVSIILPLFTVSVDHRGTWKGRWVSTEVLAAVIGIVIYYLAFSAKSHIQA
ncbi:translocon-associated protein subunit delta-like [Peromyscus eremicus]|uniref:translocon-associated protein subunit delta-like n=1 Tax=Peromyscus eremicus TaxID=42410 RepID=UPI0027DB58B8|nr:translocon-associated protein subunit delta-like [Peromyscus eremicus]